MRCSTPDLAPFLLVLTLPQRVWRDFTTHFSRENKPSICPTCYNIDRLIFFCNTWRLTNYIECRMANYREEINYLMEIGLVPSKDYIAPERFITHYADTTQFWGGLSAVAFLPIINGLGACYYAARTMWATLRAIGNLLILKPGLAGEAITDAGFGLTMSICLAVMAPIHALTQSIEVITRTISSWFVGKENVENLSENGLLTEFVTNVKPYQRAGKLFSANYFNKSRFFSTYEGAFDCLAQMASPITTIFTTGYYSLSEACSGVNSAIECLANLLICKPGHALENLRDLSVHFSLAIGLAVMTPINALVESIAFISRLGSTWVSACTSPEDKHSTIEENYVPVRHGV